MVGVGGDGPELPARLHRGPAPLAQPPQTLPVPFAGEVDGDPEEGVEVGGGDELVEPVGHPPASSARISSRCSSSSGARWRIPIGEAVNRIGAPG